MKRFSNLSVQTRRREPWLPSFVARKSIGQSLSCAGLLLVLMAGIYITYQPGLSGGFVFDDVPNLGRLSAIGDIKDSETLTAFMLSSDSIHGRPFSLLSFAVDDQSWPMDTYTLKRTNLLLHILNVLLVCWCSYLLFAIVFRDGHFQAFVVALAVSAMWAVNPFQVSTVSYIIQRMTELSATFVLLGIISFLKVRLRLTINFWKSIFFLSVIGVSLTLLGIASKESALLLTAFCGLVEYFFFCQPVELSRYKWKVWIIWKYLFFAGPLTAFLIYWIWKTSFFTTGYEYRDFTLAERLLTEARIIVDYAVSIIFPKLSHTGLFFKDIEVSSNIFKPFSTALSIAFILFLSFISFQKKILTPIVSFGIAFFLVGHLLESTFIPLELYFEHRNYLPQFGIWLALAGLVSQVNKWVSWRILGPAVGAYFVLSVFITYNSAVLWGDNRALARAWYGSNPDSLRALQFYASKLYDSGQYSKAKDMIDVGVVKFPDSLAMPVSEAVLKCDTQNYRFPVSKMVGLAKVSKVETAAFEGLQILERLLDSGAECSGLDFDALEAIYLALLDNPYYASEKIVKSRILQKLSDLAVRERDLNLAMHYLERSCDAVCTPQIRIRQAELLASAGLEDDALKYLRKAESLLHKSTLISLKEPGLEERIQELGEELAN